MSDRENRIRFTVRVQGENVRMNDWYAVAFTTDKTVATVGLIGQVCRIRCYDEMDGDQLPMPEIWFVDTRSDHVVGPVRQDEIDMIRAVDGRWMTDQEGRDVIGDDEYTSDIDCGHVNTWTHP